MSKISPKKCKFFSVDEEWRRDVLLRFHSVNGTVSSRIHSEKFEVKDMVVVHALVGGLPYAVGIASAMDVKRFAIPMFQIPSKEMRLLGVIRTNLSSKEAKVPLSLEALREFSGLSDLIEEDLMKFKLRMLSREGEKFHATAGLNRFHTGSQATFKYAAPLDSFFQLMRADTDSPYSDAAEWLGVEKSGTDEVVGRGAWAAASGVKYIPDREVVLPAGRFEDWQYPARLCGFIGDCEEMTLETVLASPSKVGEDFPARKEYVLVMKLREETHVGFLTGKVFIDSTTAYDNVDISRYGLVTELIPLNPDTPIQAFAPLDSNGKIGATLNDVASGNVTLAPLRIRNEKLRFAAARLSTIWPHLPTKCKIKEQC